MALVPAGGLNGKHYIVAALTATLFTAAIITVVFIVMSPARIHFSVARADYRVFAGDADHHDEDDGDALVRLQLTVALAVNNPSRREAVRYQSMYVSLSNNTWSTDYSLTVNVTTRMPLRQPTRNVTTIAASLNVVSSRYRIEAFTGNMTSYLAVKATAVAQFKVGLTWTRLYDIKVHCSPIDMFSAADPSRRRSQGSAAGLPVDCETTIS